MKEHMLYRAFSRHGRFRGGPEWGPEVRFWGGPGGGFGRRQRRGDVKFLLLEMLAEGPKHGYAITLDVERLSGMRLGPGTLYGALSRLEDKGLIEALPADARRRPYRLTAAGSAALREQLQTLERVARSGLDRLRVAEATG